MNWIDRFFGKGEESVTEIEFDKLPEWLESKSQKTYNEISIHASSMYSDIRDALEEIKESTAFLEDATPEGRFHIAMVKIATSNRNNMVKQIRILLDNITIPTATDVRTIADFHESAVQNFTVCLENMMKSYHYTQSVFFEESKKGITNVKALGVLLNQLIEPIKIQKNVLDAFENATSAIQVIKNTISDIGIREEVMKKNEEKIVLLKNEIEERKKALILLRDGESWKRYMNCRDELILLENNAGKKESEINDIISPLSKALVRLKQLSDSGRYILNPRDKEYLNLCLSEPGAVNPEFFVEFKKVVESDILNLAPEKKNKILGQINFIKSSFSSYKTEYQNILREIERKRDEVSGLDVHHEERELTGKISALEEKLGTAEKELEASKKHLAHLKQDIESKKHELRRALSVIDSSIRVSYT